MRRRNRKLQSICTCSDFSTRRWRSGRKTALRYETGEENSELLQGFIWSSYKYVPQLVSVSVLRSLSERAYRFVYFCDRRSREHQACHQGDLCRLKWALEKWKKVLSSSLSVLTPSFYFIIFFQNNCWLFSCFFSVCLISLSRSREGKKANWRRCSVSMKLNFSNTPLWPGGYINLSYRQCNHMISCTGFDKAVNTVAVFTDTQSANVSRLRSGRGTSQKENPELSQVLNRNVVIKFCEAEKFIFLESETTGLYQHHQFQSCLSRRVLSVWRENAGLQAESRHLEQRAQNHSQHFLLSKVEISLRPLSWKLIVLSEA